MGFEDGRHLNKPDSQVPPEFIRSPAIRYCDEIAEAPMHFAAVHRLKEKHPELADKDDDDPIFIHGFTTSAGRFIDDRKEAERIADAYDQIMEEKKGAARLRGLHSSDLKD